jgi:hypothetical protein
VTLTGVKTPIVKAVIVKYPETFDRVDLIKRELSLGGFESEPVLRGDDRLWILGSPLVVEVNGRIHEVPTGFTTDGASIPKWGQWFTGWDPWEEPQRWAAIVHDWLYCERDVIKEYSDKVFREVLRSEGSNWWQREIMFFAVRVGGGPAYRTDQSSGPRIFV